jgi:hypothetical protein
MPQFYTSIKEALQKSEETGYVHLQTDSGSDARHNYVRVHTQDKDFKRIDKKIEKALSKIKASSLEEWEEKALLIVKSILNKKIGEYGEPITDDKFNFIEVNEENLFHSSAVYDCDPAASLTGVFLQKYCPYDNEFFIISGDLLQRESAQKLENLKVDEYNSHKSVNTMHWDIVSGGTNRLLGATNGEIYKPITDDINLLKEDNFIVSSIRRKQNPDMPCQKLYPDAMFAYNSSSASSRYNNGLRLLAAVSHDILADLVNKGEITGEAELQKIKGLMSEMKQVAIEDCERFEDKSKEMTNAAIYVLILGDDGKLEEDEVDYLTSYMNAYNNYNLGESSERIKIEVMDLEGLDKVTISQGGKNISLPIEVNKGKNFILSQ